MGAAREIRDDAVEGGGDVDLAADAEDVVAVELPVDCD